MSVYIYDSWITVTHGDIYHNVIVNHNFLFWALVPAIFGPRTKDRISPGWSYQPELKVKPGLKVTLLSRLELPAMTKPLILVSGSNRN
jgi:hypothetical protein